jgi:hypothetical protein
MLKPFIVGDKTYATDGYTMIMCDNDKIDFEFENNETPLNVKPVIPEPNTYEIINIDGIDWIGLMNSYETVGDGNDVECGHCKGFGTHYDNFLYKGKFYDFEYECPVCEGSGYEEEERETPTGNKKFDVIDVIRFKDVYFYANNFYKIKKVKDLIGGDVELISHNKNFKGSMFRVGIVEILIMPCSCSDTDYVIINID